MIDLNEEPPRKDMMNSALELPVKAARF